jgi:D-mannonate dehydratase
MGLIKIQHMADNKQPFHETFKVSGDEIIAKIKEIIKEGNARRIIIKNDKDNTIMEFPLTVGAIGVLLVPLYAAVGTLAALAMDYTIVVEKRDDTEKKD